MRRPRAARCGFRKRSTRAAYKTFFKVLEYRLPTCLEQARRVGAIPVKKTDGVIVGYLKREEIQALLDFPDPSCRDGLWDRAMLHLADASGSGSGFGYGHVSSMLNPST